MTQIPNPGMNHPAWILGHVAIGFDFVAMLAGQEMMTDDKWMATFGPGSTPLDKRENYPSKAELLKKFDDVHSNTVEIIKGLSDELLAEPNETPFFQKQLPTKGDLILHLITTHALLHLGQLSAWRRCIGKEGSVLGI